MTENDLQSLLGQVLDSRFTVERLLQSVGSTAYLIARDVTTSEEFLLRLVDGEGSTGAGTFNRFREAAFLDHPNLVRIHTTGQIECRSQKFVYSITDMATSDLAEVLQQRPLSLAEVSQVLADVIAALGYLHSENLVYCALRAGSVWQVGKQWKLADYSQLRVPGKYAPQETRKMMLLPGADTPPEANQGAVSEAWDIWAMGSMLRKMLLRSADLEGIRTDPDHPVSLNRVSIPPPFDQILRESLDPDPAMRTALPKILEMLAAPVIPDDTAQPLEAPPPAAPVEISAEPEPPARAVAPPQFGALRQHKANRPWRALLGAVMAVATVGAAALVYSSQSVRSQTARVVDSVSPEAVQPVSRISTTLPALDDAAKLHPLPEIPAPGSKSGEQRQAAISSLLNQWADATRTRNVDRQVGCYAPVVDRFYGQRAVSATRLRTQEQNVFARIETVRKFEITNIKFHRVEPEWAVVSFDKVWDFGTRTHFAGSAREEWVLRPIRGEWKIASQRELKVYWLDKQAM